LKQALELKNLLSSLVEDQISLYFLPPRFQMKLSTLLSCLVVATVNGVPYPPTSTKDLHAVANLTRSTDFDQEDGKTSENDLLLVRRSDLARRWGSNIPASDKLWAESGKKGGDFWRAFLMNDEEAGGLLFDPARASAHSRWNYSIF
jgi:hypothetical protein